MASGESAGGWRAEGLKEVQSMSVEVSECAQGMLRRVDDSDIVEQMLLFPRSW